MRNGSSGWTTGRGPGGLDRRRDRTARQHRPAARSRPAAGRPLVALYRTGVPERNADLDRTLIEARPDGWIYAGQLGTGRWVFGYHTTPREAVRLRSIADDQILADAPGLNALLGPVRLDDGIVALDARGGVLDTPCGEGWISCGDAALSFDPIAGQGLFNALRSGMAAAEVVAGAMSGRAEAGGYIDEMVQVAQIYAARRRALYRAEGRWAARNFWQEQAA